MIRFAAFNFVLRTVGARAMRVAFVVKIVDTNPDDRAIDVASLGVPFDTVADLKLFGHQRTPSKQKFAPAFPSRLPDPISNA